jgi:thioesterase-3
MPQVHQYPMTILEKHLDTFGHVNNATYLEIMEEARWDFITKNGYGHKEVMKTKIGPVILELTLKFKKELYNRQKINIVSTTTEYKGKIFLIEQKILNEKNEECAIAVFTAALFDLTSRKLIDATPEWKKAIGID